MRRTISIVIHFLFLTITISAFPQGKKIVELGIGDDVPEILIKDIINHPDSAIRISRFKDRLLILDFWATWCAPCLAAFPKQDSLQKKFGDQLQILPVTSEDKKVVQQFLGRMKNVKKILPATATNDRLLRRYFTHVTLPHYVWVSKGKVIAITEGVDITEKNIRDVIDDKIVSLRLKKDIVSKIVVRPDEPMFASVVRIADEPDSPYTKLNNKDVMIHSTLTKFMEGLDGTLTADSTMIRVVNLNISWLYRIALLKFDNKMINPASLAVEVDSVLYTLITGRTISGNSVVKPGLEALEWLRWNSYCYELKIRPELKNDKFEIMLSQLNSYFGARYGIEGLIEKRKTKYLALIRTKDKIEIASKGGIPSIKQDKFYLKVQNRNIKSLKTHLSILLQKYPLIIDETEYDTNIDIELNGQLTDLPSINKELLKFGLLLEEKEKAMEVAVIKNKQKVL